MKNYDVEPMETANTARHLLTGVLVGGLIGATTMWLFAPHSGEETRSDLFDKATDLRDRTTETVKDTVSQVKSRAGSLRGEVKGKAGDLKSIGQDLLVEIGVHAVCAGIQCEAPLSQHRHQRVVCQERDPVLALQALRDFGELHLHHVPERRRIQGTVHQGLNASQQRAGET